MMMMIMMKGGDEAGDEVDDEANATWQQWPRNIHRTFCGDICALWFCNYL